MNLKGGNILSGVRESTIRTFGDGMFYNWYAITSGKLAPFGTHVPTGAELTTLVTYLGGTTVAGGKLKSTRINTPGWASGNLATNESGFNALGSGRKDSLFSLYQTQVNFWSRDNIDATNGYRLVINRTSITCSLGNIAKWYGCSVRCLLDLPASAFPGNPPDVVDYEGNVYKTIKIGDQVWLLSNLKCTKYNDGTDIPYVTGSWVSVVTPAYCIYGDATKPREYRETQPEVRYGVFGNGYLYNWLAASSDIAPTGTRVATKSDWDTLITYVGGYGVASKKLRSPRTAINPGWISPNDAEDSYGFKLCGGGRRWYNGSFQYLGERFMTCYSDNRNEKLYFSNTGLASFVQDVSTHGYSLRCVVTDLAGYFPGKIYYDYDNNAYESVKIGTQVWLTSNLKTSRMNNGTLIPEVQGESAWAALTSPGRCTFNNAAILEFVQ